MSFDAFCYCPRCGKGWYECATGNETYTCPNCSYQGIEPEDLDSDLDMDEEEVIAIIKYLEKRHSKNLD